MDEITLQQLRTGGMAYHQPEEATDRAATLSRLQGKKMKERPGKGGYLSVLQPGSEELLSDGKGPVMTFVTQCSEGYETKSGCYHVAH